MHPIKKPQQPRGKNHLNLKTMQGRKCIGSLEKSLCSLVHLKRAHDLDWES
jgi:hypothetical protein